MSGDNRSNSLAGSLDTTVVKQGINRLGGVRDRLGNKASFLYLLAIMVFMAGVRLQSWDKFVKNGQVYISGNDGWYHLRQSMYVTQNWPNTMPYDLLTGYPVGVNAGTFGTLFDQIVGTIALLVGLGSPDQATVTLVLLLTTVAFASLLVLPVYYITKELTDAGAGVLASAILALLPGLFLARGVFGNGDHQMAEALFLFVAIAAYFVALRVAQENVLVLETLHPETIRDSKKELKYALLAGLAFTAYILTWPPGLIFFVAFGVFFSIVATIAAYSEDYLAEPVLIIGGVSMLVPVVGLLLYIDSFALLPAGYSLLQVLFALMASASCWTLIGLNRLVDEDGVPAFAVPVSVLGSVLGGATIIKLARPEAYAKIMQNLDRTLLLRSGDQTLTIAEARQFVSLGNFTQPLYGQYGLMFFVGIVGFGLLAGMAYRQYRRNELFSQHLLLLVFGLFITLMGFTQVRFNYYLAPAVAIFAAYGIYQLVEITGVGEISLSNIEPYKVIVLFLLVVLFVPGLIYPLGGTAVAQGDRIGGVGAYGAWEEPLDWANENTPDNGIETYGTYEDTDTPYADTPEAYGVLSWWDYGHWITVTAEQSPVSNPFQQHATESAEYLLATNESDAEAAVNDLSETGDADVKYVYVDWQMVSPSSKFTAPVTWHPELNQSDMMMPVYTQDGQGIRTAAILKEQRYYESLMVRLYHYHGSQADVAPFVVQYDQQQIETRNGPQTINTFNLGPQSDSGIQRFDSVQEARNYAANNSQAEVGGFGRYPKESVSALENYRLVKTSERSALESRRYQQSIGSVAQYAKNTSLRYGDFGVDPSWVKIFENVDGATVEGSGAPANSTVTIVIQMNNPAQDTEFNYYQTAEADENGNFEFTVPYSTTGYDNYGPENGHGNVEVKAVGDATVYTQQQSIETTENGTVEANQTIYAAETHIQEGKVIGEDDSPVTVTLEEVTREEIQSYFENNRNETDSN